MVKLYIIIALRYLRKNKLYSFINIFGLAIGLASFVLIMLYVGYEESYDRFEGSEFIYRAYMDYLEGETFVAGDAQTYNLTGPTFKREFPEVLEYVTLRQLNKVSIMNGQNMLMESKGFLVDPSYFDIFDQKIVKGDMDGLLQEPYTAVLSESFAKKVFGDGAAIGRTIKVIEGSISATFSVRAVMEDLPPNRHLDIQFLVSMSSLPTWGITNGFEPNWSQNNYYTYLKIDENADIAALKKKVMESDFEDDEDERHNIEAIQDIHLHSNKPYEAKENGSATRVKFLSVIAFMILMLSWLNYINLSTTKSLERAKEIGIRKVAGAIKGQLIAQSFLESIILNLIAIAFAMVIALYTLPQFVAFTGKAMSFELLNIRTLLPILGYIFLAMLISGLYPAILLSSYSPITALKGKVRASNRGLNIRKTLIISQFAVTIIMIIGTIVVTQQNDFIESRPIGADLQNVIAVNGDIVSSRPDSLVREDYLRLANDLSALPFVRSVSSAKTYPGDGYEELSSFVGLTDPDGNTDERTIYYNYSVSTGYFDLMGIDFLAGRESKEVLSGYSDEIIINETLAKDIGFADPALAVDEVVKFFGLSWRIVGVIEDYHHFGLKNRIDPLLIITQGIHDLLLVKLDDRMATTDLHTTKAQIEAAWMNVFPHSSIEITDVESKFAIQNVEDEKFGVAFRFFTLLAIIIATLGLFGLTSYTCIQRRKEIGIRKVNGASILSILKLLNLDFIKWIGIAFVIAVPVSWYIMEHWLETFAMRIDLKWWVFLVAGLAAMVISGLTVSTQTYLAARANPISALRDE